MGANTSLPSISSSDSKNALAFDGLLVNSVSASVANSTELPLNSIGLIFSKDRKLRKLKDKIKTKLKKSCSHSQVFRDFASLLNQHELIQIYEEYRSTFFMKELALHAESARPITSTIRNDLSELYDLKQNSDITLVYKGVDFPVHKAIVCVRCPFFRELLGKKQPGSVVNVNLEIKGLRVELFNDLLKYLYTGELAGSYDPRSNTASYQALIRISQECGVPNLLAHDLKYLLETGIYSDASLCFQISSSDAESRTRRCTCFEQSEFSCHQAILSARSPFFKNVILRQQRRNSTLKQDTLNQRIKIVLDESIIPRRFARTLLHVMYRDSEDLVSILQSSLCKCQNSQSSQNTKENQPYLVKEIMDLYEIARFLEIDFLVQSCEDLIIEFLTIDTIIPVLKWSEQPHGSPWVKRQALSFLREEFSLIISSSSLLQQLSYLHLLEAIKSDFLEASELDILKAIVKWGEFHFSKQFEEKEKEHSLTRRSFRKKEIDDAKLGEFISELISFVRVSHILPLDSEYLLSISKRNLIEYPTSLDKDSNSMSTKQTLASWFRSCSINGNFVKPRFFTPYFEECKVVLEERLGIQLSLDDSVDNLLASFSRKCTLQVPDNLYMVEKLNFGTHNCAETVVSDGDLMPSVPNFHFCFTSSSSSSVACYEEFGKPRPNLPVLEEKILFMMRQREQELKTSPFCVRALKIPYNRCEALRLIQLRVVREFGLPDVASDVLHYRNGTSLPVDLRDDTTQVYYTKDDNCEFNIPPPPPRPMSAFLQAHCDPFSYDTDLKLESSSRYELDTQFSSTESHQTLSDLIPDIALAGREV